MKQLYIPSISGILQKLHLQVIRLLKQLLINKTQRSFA